MKKLTATNVEDIFKSCLAAEDEQYKEVEGIIAKYAINEERLNENADDIKSMLMQLPESFMESGGGGYTFLGACCDKDGYQWGEQYNMEHLFVLGLALGKVKELLPRELWGALPGGVPYYMVVENEK